MRNRGAAPDGWDKHTHRERHTHTHTPVDNKMAAVEKTKRYENAGGAPQTKSVEQNLIQTSSLVSPVVAAVVGSILAGVSFLLRYRHGVMTVACGPLTLCAYPRVLCAPSKARHNRSSRVINTQWTGGTTRRAPCLMTAVSHEHNPTLAQNLGCWADCDSRGDESAKIPTVWNRQACRFGS